MNRLKIIQNKALHFKSVLRKTTHLKKVGVENTCVNVAYISDTKYKIITTVTKIFKKHFVNVAYIYLYIYLIDIYFIYTRVRYKVVATLL